MGDDDKPGQKTRTITVRVSDANPLDDKAKKIIASAHDARSVDQRAIEAVKSIVQTYYDPSMVDSVVYDQDEPGVSTSPVGSGSGIKGKIFVGHSFVENIDNFARRVLQVGHEMQHVQQQRSGMGGQAKKSEREFLAHHWEATQPEKPGTGKMKPGDRLRQIDDPREGALKYYDQMPESDRQKYAQKKEELVQLRARLQSQ